MHGKETDQILYEGGISIEHLTIMLDGQMKYLHQGQQADYSRIKLANVKWI